MIEGKTVFIQFVEFRLKNNISQNKMKGENCDEITRNMKMYL